MADAPLEWLFRFCTWQLGYIAGVKLGIGEEMEGAGTVAKQIT